MLHHLQPCMQALFRIPWLDRHLFPADYGSGIDLGRHIMYCAACHLYASIQGLPDGMESAKDGNLHAIFRRIRMACTIIWQERGVQVYYALGKLLKK